RFRHGCGRSCGTAHDLAGDDTDGTGTDRVCEAHTDTVYPSGGADPADLRVHEKDTLDQTGGDEAGSVEKTGGNPHCIQCLPVLMQAADMRVLQLGSSNCFLKKDELCDMRNKIWYT